MVNVREERADPLLDRHPLVARLNMIEYNQNWLEDFIRAEIVHDDLVLTAIRWCKWWGGMRRTMGHMPDDTGDQL